MDDLTLLELRTNYDATLWIWLDAVRAGDQDAAAEALMWRAHLARRIAERERR